MHYKTGVRVVFVVCTATKFKGYVDNGKHESITRGKIMKKVRYYNISYSRKLLVATELSL